MCHDIRMHLSVIYKVHHCKSSLFCGCWAPHSSLQTTSPNRSRHRIPSSLRSSSLYLFCVADVQRRVQACRPPPRTVHVIASLLAPFRFRSGNTHGKLHRTSSFMFTLSFKRGRRQHTRRRLTAELRRRNTRGHLLQRVVGPRAGAWAEASR